jgi:hypothetical protein
LHIDSQEVAFALLVVCLGFFWGQVGTHKFHLFSFVFVDELGLILFVKVLMIYECFFLRLLLKLEIEEFHQICNMESE